LRDLGWKLCHEGEHDENERSFEKSIHNVMAKRMRMIWAMPDWV
jgi:hypothetical protein